MLSATALDAPDMRADQPIRVILVEDEGLFRDLLRVALSRKGDIEVVGDFADGSSALQLGPSLRPDVAILDVQLGDEPNGIQLGRLLRERQPGLGIVLLSNHAHPAVLSAVPDGEMSGWSYLLKQSLADLATLERAITGVSAGLIVLDPHLIQHGSAGDDTPLAGLTPRRREILALIAQGYSNYNIASRLGVSRKTIENQVNLVFQSLHIDTADPDVAPRVHAVLAYLRATGAR